MLKSCHEMFFLLWAMECFFYYGPWNVFFIMGHGMFFYYGPWNECFFYYGPWNFMECFFLLWAMEFFFIMGHGPWNHFYYRPCNFFFIIMVYGMFFYYGPWNVFLLWAIFFLLCGHAVFFIMGPCNIVFIGHAMQFFLWTIEFQVCAAIWFNRKKSPEINKPNLQTRISKK